MPNPISVLVTGATGKQGGALARRLLKNRHSVRALTRKPNSAPAQDLKRLGAQLVTGDLQDRSTLEQAMRGVDAVFAMSTPFESGTDMETRQGIAVADAAKSQTVRHLVFTSVASANRNTGIPHFESKYKVEQHIQAIGIPYTIVGPVFFCENFISPWWLPGLQQGQLTMALPASRELDQVSLADIAGFVTLVLENREKFLGKRIDIASDRLTGQKVVEILTHVSGRPIQYVELPVAQLRATNEDFAKMFEWFNRVGYRIDIAALRRDYPEVGWHTFEQWAKPQDWNILRKSPAR